MAIAFCPDCEESISVGPRPKVGQRITCPHCNADLEVIDSSPLELDWAYDGPEDDWDDEEWDDEEEEDEEDDEDDWDDEEDDDEDWDDQDL
jgi:glutaredoxin